MAESGKNSTDVIKDGYRINVGMVIANADDRLFWGCRKASRQAWQFPQGGVKVDETLEEAMYRELEEEVGLVQKDVEYLAQTKRWYRYKIPPAFQRADRAPCLGQQQRWFLLRLTGDERSIDLTASGKPEFEKWEWVDYWYPVIGVAPFKRTIYHDVLTEFAPILGIPGYHKAD